MGRFIDINKARKEYSNLTDVTMNDTTLLLTLFDVLDNAPTVEVTLDKIKTQIEDYLHGVEITLEVLAENDPLRPKMEGAKDTLEECMELINDAESED